MFKMIDAAGVESAPFDSDTLISYARQGIILPATMILDIAAGRWAPAGEHSLLGGAPPASASGAIPPPTAGSLGNYVPYVPNPQAARASSWPKIVGLLAALGVLAFMGLIAAGFWLADKEGGSAKSETQTVMTDDGRYAITLPTSWIRWKTDDKATIAYIDVTSGNSVTMNSLDDNGTDTTDLRLLMDNVVRLEAKTTQDTPIGKPISIKVGGLPAYQQDMTDSSGSKDLQTRITLIGAPKSAYMIMTIGNTAATGADAPAVNTVVSTFRKVTSPIKAPPTKA
ncbi:MAG: hypothetical protein ABIY70_09260 [Capsulimonas sp.]|uniref:hypothetical protein n=1 Tax=Capsulimonas sp. TaxID=2494211 RepID=UPI0032664B1D